MKTYTHAYIYLIREREFLLRNEPVFKIGRGEQDADRIVKRVATGYKKGSEIWLTTRCPISLYKQAENTLKNTFRERFTEHGDGSEYFSGDPTEMVKIISSVVENCWSDLAMEETEQAFHGVVLSDEQLEFKKSIDTMEATLNRDHQLREQLEISEAKCRAAVLALRRSLAARVQEQTENGSERS